MFSGLGAQSAQMGRTLFHRPGPFREWMLRLDRLAFPLIGRSVAERLYDPSRPSDEPLSDLLEAYFSIYMTEIATAETLRERGVTADCLLAVSLGFYAAATLAGCLTPEEVLHAMTTQVRAIETHCPPGGMLAIIGPAALYDDPAISRRCDLASAGVPSHFVVAGSRDALDHVERHLKMRDVQTVRLAAGYAFHSRWLEPVRGSLETLLTAMAGRRPRIPIVCCARASYLERIEADTIWPIARQPIRLTESIAHLERQGPHRYIDAGPSGSLAATVKSLLARDSRSTVAATLTPFHRDAENIDRIAHPRSAGSPGAY